MQDIHSSMTNTTRDNLFAGEVDQPPINNHHDILKCPRCQSLNTKFCYYNNYNLSQPRHLCKSCRRYWTNGGILRNVPVGGGIRKTKPKPKRSGKIKTGAEMVVCNYSSSENFSSDCLNATRSNTSTTTTTTNYSSSENFCNDGSRVVTTNTTTIVNNNNNYSSSENFCNDGSLVVTTNTTTIVNNNNNYSSSENFSSDCSGVTTNTTTANKTTCDPSRVKPDMLVNFNELSARMLCSPVGRFDMMLNQSQMNNDLQWTDMEMNMPEMRSSVMMDYDINNNNIRFENMKSDGQVVGKDDRRNIDGEDLYYLSGTADEFYWCHNQWCGDDDDDDDDDDRGQLDCLT